MAQRHYITSVNIKKLSWLVGYRMCGCCRWWIIYSLFSQQLESINVSLMADCNPKMFMFMKHK